MTDRLLTPHEVAEKLGVKLHTVYSLGRERRIPGTVRIGRLMRFRPAEIERWIQDGGTPDNQAA